MVSVKVFSLALAACAVLTLSQATPINATSHKHWHRCESIKEHQEQLHLFGDCIPQCDDDGNFLPQQQCASTGYSWCVEILTGEEIPHTRTGPGVTPADCAILFPCPYYWSYYGGKCFMFYDSLKTWVEAEAFCLFEGANLASIHSYEENRFVQGLTEIYSDFPETWIGAQDAVQTSFWMWSDGSDFRYENWIENPPPTDCGHCAMMNVGLEWKWKPYSCNKTLPFVCSKRMQIFTL